MTALAAISLAGCAMTGQAPLTWHLDSIREQTAEAHTSAAVAYEQKGNTRAAIEEWRVVSALKPDSKDVTARIRELEVSVTNSSVRLLQQARREQARGSLPSARNLTLAALAFDPDSDAARELLRSIEEKRAQYQLAAEPLEPTPPKPESEYYENLAPEGTQTETRAFLRADPNLAEKAFRRGLALFGKDKAGAARSFDDALRYDPNHQKARTYRDTLRRLGFE